MELTFNEKVGASEVDTLLSEITKDGQLGDLEVSKVVTDASIEGQLFLHYTYLRTSNLKQCWAVNKYIYILFLHFYDWHPAIALSVFTIVLQLLEV